MDIDAIAVLGAMWPQIVTMIPIVGWAYVLNHRVKDNSSRLDRHDNRLTQYEDKQQSQAIQLARIEEAIASIKLTADRTYIQVSELGRVAHWNEKTIPPR